MIRGRHWTFAFALSDSSEAILRVNIPHEAGLAMKPVDHVAERHPRQPADHRSSIRSRYRQIRANGFC